MTITLKDGHNTGKKYIYIAHRQHVYFLSNIHYSTASWLRFTPLVSISTATICTMSTSSLINEPALQSHKVVSSAPLA